jgi:anti-anti-sigma factor
MSMEIREERLEGDIVVIAVVGRLDPATASQLEPPLVAAASAPTRGLVLDLGGVDYVSSAGLRVLLVAGKRLHERRARLTLHGVRPYVKQILDLAGFSTLFPTCASREEAVAAARG